MITVCFANCPLLCKYSWINRYHGRDTNHSFQYRQCSRKPPSRILHQTVRAAFCDSLLCLPKISCSRFGNYKRLSLISLAGSITICVVMLIRWQHFISKYEPAGTTSISVTCDDVYPHIYWGFVIYEWPLIESRFRLLGKFDHLPTWIIRRRSLINTIHWSIHLRPQRTHGNSY